MDPQFNFVTKKRYEGSNGAILDTMQHARHHDSNEWLTRAQAIATHRRIKKGAKGVPLRKEKGEKYYVFNLEETYIYR